MLISKGKRKEENERKIQIQLINFEGLLKISSAKSYERDRRIGFEPVGDSRKRPLKERAEPQKTASSSSSSACFRLGYREQSQACGSLFIYDLYSTLP